MVDRSAAEVRVALAVERAAAALVVAFWIWQAAARPHPITWLLGAASVIFVTVWVFVLPRRIRPPALTEGVEAALRDRAARAQDEAWWYRFVQLSLATFLLVTAPLGVWKYRVDHAMYTAEPWRAVVGYGGVLLLSAGVFTVAQRRRRAALRLRDIAQTELADVLHAAADRGE